MGKQDHDLEVRFFKYKRIYIDDLAALQKNPSQSFLTSISSGVEMANVVSLTITKMIQYIISYVAMRDNDISDDTEPEESPKKNDRDDKKSRQIPAYDGSERSKISKYLWDTVDALVIIHLKNYIEHQSLQHRHQTDVGMSKHFKKFAKIIYFLRHNKPMLSGHSLEASVSFSPNDDDDATDVEREKCKADGSKESSNFRHIFDLTFEKQDSWIYLNINSILNTYFTMNNEQ